MPQTVDAISKNGTFRPPQPVAVDDGQRLRVTMPRHAGPTLGTSDRTAAAVTTRPITYQDVFATLYHTLGINALRTTIVDPRGRPQYLLDGGEVLREVV